MAIRLSLAEIFAVMMGVVLRPELTKIAKNARAVIRRENISIKELALGGNGSNGYLPILGDR
jgi:hypothetical protein